MEPLSTVKTIFDLAFGVITGFRSQRADLFNRHVDPLHKRVLEVHADYVTGFQQTRQILSDKTKPSVEVIAFLKERRREYAAERDLSGKLAQALDENRPFAIGDNVWAATETYVKAVTGYFVAPESVARQSWYSDFIAIMEARTRAGVKDVYDTHAFGQDAREDLVQLIDGILDRGLPAALAAVNSSYATLRAQLL